MRVPREIETKYETLDKIREGGMGAVYRVRHRLLRREYVIKVVHPRLTVDPEFGERFWREAEIASGLNHPNVVQLHDYAFDADDGTACMVMELIDGKNLAEVREKLGALPIGLTLEIARQALDALAYLHAKGLIHRDIAPDNLMLARDHRGGPLVKMIDLGIAKPGTGDGRLTTTGVFLGKPAYASPEQIDATKPLDERSDLYSFGVVLYELLTGMHPVEGQSPSALIAGHLLRPPKDFAVSDPAGRIPADLRAILSKALEKERADRFQSTEEFSSRLAAVQARYPVAAGDVESALGSVPPKPLAPPESVQGVATHPAADQQTVPMAHATLRDPQELIPTMPLPAVAAAEAAPAPELADLDLRREPPRPTKMPAPSTRPRHRQSLSKGGLLLIAAGLLVLVTAVVLFLSGGLPWPSRQPKPDATEQVVKRTEPEKTPPPAGPSTSEHEGAASQTPHAHEPVATPAPPAQAPPPSAPRKEGKPDLRLGSESFESEPPQLLEELQVVLPPSVAASRSRAEIEMYVLVDETGKVVDARIEKSRIDSEFPDSVFTEAALAAARKARFQAATEKGVPVKRWTPLPITIESGS